ncbi:MAG: hypothetical protein U0169_27555 [Polyangiaceae bacterium]
MTRRASSSSAGSLGQAIRLLSTRSRVAAAAALLAGAAFANACASPMAGNGYVPQPKEDAGTKTKSKVKLPKPSNADVDGNVTAAPVLRRIDPTSAPAGAQNVTVTLTGDGFTRDVVVDVDGSSVTPNVKDAHTLTFVVPAAKLANAAVLNVMIVRETGRVNSNPLGFTIVGVRPPTPDAGTGGTAGGAGAAGAAGTAGSPGTPDAGTPTPTVVLPTITTLSPASFVRPEDFAGPLVVKFTGTGFTTTSAVLLNATAVTTTFTSATELSASIPEGLVRESATLTFTVRTGATAFSAPKTFTVTVPPKKQTPPTVDAGTPARDSGTVVDASADVSRPDGAATGTSRPDGGATSTNRADSGTTTSVDTIDCDAIGLEVGECKATGKYAGYYCEKATSGSKNTARLNTALCPYGASGVDDSVVSRNGVAQTCKKADASEGECVTSGEFAGARCKNGYLYDDYACLGEAQALSGCQGYNDGCHPQREGYRCKNYLLYADPTCKTIEPEVTADAGSSTVDWCSGYGGDVCFEDGSGCLDGEFVPDVCADGRSTPAGSTSSGSTTTPDARASGIDSDCSSDDAEGKCIGNTPYRCEGYVAKYDATCGDAPSGSTVGDCTSDDMYGKCIDDYYRCQYYQAVYDPSCSATTPDGSGGSGGSAGSAGTAGSGGEEEDDCAAGDKDDQCVDYYHRCYGTVSYYDERCYDEYGN